MVRRRGYDAKENAQKLRAFGYILHTQRQKIMKLFIVVLLLLLCASISYGQKLKNLDDSIQSEIGKKIPKLKAYIESNEMNPGLKNVESAFAVDTFKIEYYQRRKGSLHSTIGTIVSVTKYVTAQYRILLNKYYLLAMQIATPDEKKNIIASQEAWESFQKKEAVSLFEIYRKNDIANSNYLRAYGLLIKTRAIALFDCYVELKE